VRTPRLVVAGAALAAAFFALPVAALVARAPWSAALDVLARPMAREALRISLVASGAAVLLALALALPLAWILARTRFPGRSIVRLIVVLPMVLPPVVAGVGLLAAFGRRGMLGGALEALGVQLPFTLAAAVLAATFVSAPFLVLSLEAGLRGLDPRVEEAAATLGASAPRVAWTVVLPALRPALLAGTGLAWARALGEFGATITFAGNLRGRTQTLPLAVYETLQTDPGAALVLSLGLLGLSALLLVALRGLAARGPA